MSNEMKDWMRDNELETGDPYNSGEKLCCCLNNYGKLIRMSLDELAEFLDSYSGWDESPWTIWFDKTFCKKCEPVEIEGMHYAKCELEGENCLPCGKLANAPTIEIIKEWLRH